MPCYQNVGYQDVLLPRCPITKMSVTKMSYCRNVQLPKCPVTEMSCDRNVLLPKCQLPKRPLPKCPLPKCLDTVCDCPNESTGLLFQFWSIQRVTKRQLTDTVFHCTVATSV